VRDPKTRKFAGALTLDIGTQHCLIGSVESTAPGDGPIHPAAPVAPALTPCPRGRGHTGCHFGAERRAGPQDLFRV